jgi:hypothetical protein
MNFSVIRSLSPMAVYFARSTFPRAYVGGSVQTPRGWSFVSFGPRKSLAQKRPLSSARQRRIAPDSKMTVRCAAAGRVVVYKNRHPVVGVEREEAWLELVSSTEVAGDDAVLQPRLLEKDGDFLAVRRGPVVEIDHGFVPP